MSRMSRSLFTYVLRHPFLIYAFVTGLVLFASGILRDNWNPPEYDDKGTGVIFFVLMYILFIPGILAFRIA